MPQVGRPAQSFIALWVEDDIARIWNIEVATGALDELARFSISGMKRPNVLELARQFVKARGPRTNIIDELTQPAIVSEPYARPAKRGTAKRQAARGDRTAQIARQTELYQTLKTYGPQGVTGPALAAHLTRKANGIGVSLGILERQGKARHVGDKWIAIDNGNEPASAE